MSQRRLDALRARMERGATEGERRAAARAYEIHSKKEHANEKRGFYDAVIHHARCPKCGVSFPARQVHNCSRVESPRTNAGPFRPQPPPRDELLHANVKAMMDLAQQATNDRRRITIVLKIAFNNTVTWSIQTEPEE